MMAQAKSTFACNTALSRYFETCDQSVDFSHLGVTNFVVLLLPITHIDGGSWCPAGDCS